MGKTETGLRIGILAYPGAQTSAVHGLTDLFLTAQRFQDAGPTPLLSVSHWQLTSDHRAVRENFASDPAAKGRLKAIILPPCLDSQLPSYGKTALTTWIADHYASGAIACSICAGAFLLAEAGLLQGRPATTHWALKEDFAQRYPAVKLDTDSLIVDDGDIITAGGVMAWTDLGLRLVDRLLGSSVMLELARFFLVDPGGREQRFYSTFAPRLTHGDEAVLKVQRWLQTHFAEAQRIGHLAALAGLSERTFLRRFQKATGLKPTAYIQALRVGKARDRLERSGLPFSTIAWDLGYSDPAAFSKIFQRHLGLSPGDYRRRFGVG